jgi:hypothetical protein
MTKVEVKNCKANGGGGKGGGLSIDISSFSTTPTVSFSSLVMDGNTATVGNHIFLMYNKSDQVSDGEWGVEITGESKGYKVNAAKGRVSTDPADSYADLFSLIHIPLSGTLFVSPSLVFSSSCGTSSSSPCPSLSDVVAHSERGKVDGEEVVSVIQLKGSTPLYSPLSLSNGEVKSGKTQNGVLLFGEELEQEGGGGGVISCSAFVSFEKIVYSFSSTSPLPPSYSSVFSLSSTTFSLDKCTFSISATPPQGYSLPTLFSIVESTVTMESSSFADLPFSSSSSLISCPSSITTLTNTSPSSSLRLANYTLSNISSSDTTGSMLSLSSFTSVRMEDVVVDGSEEEANDDNEGEIGNENERRWNEEDEQLCMWTDSLIHFFFRSLS